MNIVVFVRVDKCEYDIHCRLGSEEPSDLQGLGSLGERNTSSHDGVVLSAKESICHNVIFGKSCILRQ